MRDPIKGVLAMVIACTIWGLSPLFWALLSHVPSTLVIGYRTLWSLMFFAAVLAAQGRLGLLLGAVRNPRSFLIILAAGVMIASNWLTFISAIHNGRGVEASLGYYIFPLVAVLLGRVAFGEALARSQWVAVGLAACAVLTLTIGLGVPPWISLILGVTFGLYGLIKKSLDLGPVVSVTAEVLLLAPFAIAYIAFAGQPLDMHTHLLLALSGPFTAIPLILFSYAARRVRLSTIGLTQYLNPTLQFFIAVFVFAEPFTPWHAIAFPLIWAALAIYSVAALRQDRASRRVVSNAATSGTIEM